MGNKLGLYYYVDDLLGMNILEAEQFIVDYHVYFNFTSTDRITQINVSSPDEVYTEDFNLNRINVEVFDQIIVKILFCG